MKMIGTEYRFETESMVVYEGEGFRMCREYHAEDAPNGEHFRGMWVLRNPEGEVVDYGYQRIVLARRNDIELVHLENWS
jgi:hypothetical protein